MTTGNVELEMNSMCHHLQTLHSPMIRKLGSSLISHAVILTQCAYFQISIHRSGKSMSNGCVYDRMQLQPLIDLHGAYYFGYALLTISIAKNQCQRVQLPHHLLVLVRAKQPSYLRSIRQICHHRYQHTLAGQMHCAAVCSKGSLHTWGWGKNGRLGHGDEEPRTNPTPVSYFGNASFGAVSCGYAHTLVSSSEDGSVYGFGWNVHNQVIGNADIGLSDCLLPTICLKKKEVVKLSCGFAHSAAVSAMGTLFTWGKKKPNVVMAGTRTSSLRSAFF